ncbi:MAG: NADH-quinone oxidoreductase subunit C [Thermoflexales bacterium]|nr:NADH-quinone oxidoreductase subunit C [Thermoflexales bacterium]
MSDSPLAQSLGDLITETRVFRDEVTLITTRERVVEVLTRLRDGEHFEVLTDLTAVDFHPAEPRFALVYLLTSLQRNMRVRIKCFLNGSERAAPTVSGVFASANWLEREVYDLFGIHFEGHPDLRRIVLPNDYVGHPLLKEVPVQVEEVSFTFNRRRIEAGKIFAGE